MKGFKHDMSLVWDSFEVDVGAQLERINEAVTQGFDNIRKIALSTYENEPGATKNSQSAMQTLVGVLRRRQHVTLCGIVKASEDFDSNLYSLYTDAFKHIRTAFIGKLMEGTYHAANLEYGKPLVLASIPTSQYNTYT